jgi:hypothetical protein
MEHPAPEKTDGGTAMRQSVHGRLSGTLLRLALASVLSGLSVLPAAVYANPSNAIVLVPPTALPTLARQGGEAMFLHDTEDGRTFLYVEQQEGTRLAIFDVTDPAHVRGEGSVQLDAAGPFDLVAHLGKRGELVRFRGGKGDAVLDLRRTPTLKKMPGLDTQNSTILVADDNWRVAGQPINAPFAHGSRDYKIFQSGESPGDERVIEVKQVRQEATNADTGTTFLLAQNGLYLIRRPALEATPSEVFPK